MNQFIESKQNNFNQAIDYFKKEISLLRTGRANPNILDAVQVDAYNTKTPINGVASISVPDAQSIVVAPWDKSIIKEIEKAIVDADLGLGVVNEGEQIRLTVPKMTEENRKHLVKKLNEKQEEARIKIRKVRDEVKEEIEKAFTEKEITEDEKFKFIKELDEFTKEKNEELKEIRDKKEEDIMTI